MELIKCSDYVIWRVNQAPIKDYDQVNEDFVNDVISYANFLKQPLTLGMFISCDEEGNVLSEQNHKAHSSVTNGEMFKEHTIKIQVAEEDIMFEGFKIIKTYNGNPLSVGINYHSPVAYYNDQHEKFEFYDRFKAIEDLTELGLTLTNSAITKLK